MPEFAIIFMKKKHILIVGIALTIILIFLVWYYFIDCVGSWEYIHSQNEHCCLGLYIVAEPDKTSCKPYEYNEEIKEEWKNCSQDSDCYSVDITCCGACPIDVYVNRNGRDVIENWKLQNCIITNLFCPYILCNRGLPMKIVCLNRTCNFTFINK